MYYSHLIIRIFLMFFLSGCSLLNEKYDGAVLEKKSWSDFRILSSVHVGMTREQVEYIFGRPIISDSFNDAYHYLFYKKESRKKNTLSLFFKKNRVCSIKIN